MVLWYRIMGRLFVPVGLYFAMLVNPVFNPRSKGGKHGAQVGIVVMIYAFLLSVLVVYPNYFLFFANRWIRAAFLGYITWFTFVVRGLFLSLVGDGDIESRVIQILIFPFSFFSPALELRGAPRARRGITYVVRCGVHAVASSIGATAVLLTHMNRRVKREGKTTG